MEHVPHGDAYNMTDRKQEKLQALVYCSSSHGDWFQLLVDQDGRTMERC